MMFGGNVPCKIMNGHFIPIPSTNAYLNITYNYARYYYEAFPSADENGNPEQNKADKEQFGIISDEGGIRSLNGVTGLAAVPILQEMINRISKKYKNQDGTWIVTRREEPIYIDSSTGKEVEFYDVLSQYLQLKKNSASTEEVESAAKRYEEKKKILHVDEGSNGDDYWTPTAANAIRPLYQLITLSRMRPDGVWSEES